MAATATQVTHAITMERFIKIPRLGGSRSRRFVINRCNIPFGLIKIKERLIRIIQSDFAGFGATGSRPMVEAALKSETMETTAAKQGVEWPNFELPKLAACDLYHDLFEQTCITLARGASEYSAKMVNTMSANSHNILEFAGELASARSWPEVAAAYTSQGRKQFDAFSAQAKELSELAQKVTTEVLAPMTSALPKMLETAAASS